MLVPYTVLWCRTTVNVNISIKKKKHSRTSVGVAQFLSFIQCMYFHVAAGLCVWGWRQLLLHYT